MPFTPIGFKNSPDTSTPISAANLNHMQTQYTQAVADSVPRTATTSRVYATTTAGGNTTLPYATGTTADSIVRRSGDQILVTESPTLPNSAVSRSFVASSIASATSGTDSFASIKHVELPDGVNYEVIRVRGGRNAIQKIQPSAVSATGTLPSASILNPKQMSEQSGYTTLLNADAWGGTTTLRVAGLSIIDGKAIQNFGVQAGELAGSNLEAILLMNDGSLQPAYASDGKTAVQYVEEGAFASFGYGPIVVLNGAIRNFAALPEFSGFATQVSARMIFGQAANGDYLFIQVDGKTGEYGIAGNRIGQIAQSEGCVIAMNLDGGGSVQNLWKGDLIHPSTDASGVRSAFNYIAIKAPIANDYDSGDIVIPSPAGVTVAGSSGGIAPVTIRQRGAEATLTLLADATYNAQSWVVLTTTGIPVRYRALSDALMKGVVYGTSGVPMGVSCASNTFVVNARSQVSGQSSGTALGQIRWRLKAA